MKRIFACILGATLVCSSKAQVEVLPPDFTLFDKTDGDYCADWNIYFLEHPTNLDYLFPDAGPLSDQRVYFLERLPFYYPSLGVQTYFVPDDVYVYLPIIARANDNTDVSPPLSPEELRDGLHAVLDLISAPKAVIDGVPLADPASYLTESPFYSMFFATTDNYYNLEAGHPILGLVDPEVAGGYMLMLKPLPDGLHDVQTAYTFGEPNGFTRERHYQIYSLPVPQYLAHQTDRLASQITNSDGAAQRLRPLLATLVAATRSFTSANFRVGINQVRAFEKIVNTQVAGSDPDLAARLTQGAEQIIQKAIAQSNL